MVDVGFTCPLCRGGSAKQVMQLEDLLQPGKPTPVERRDPPVSTTQKSFPLVQCDSCGLLRLHPQPDTETLAAAYEGAYGPFVRSGLSGKAKGWLEARSVRKLWHHFAPPLRVLDVGCARGELLAAIRRRGNLKVTGVEPSPDASRQARDRGLDVRTGTLEENAFPDESFDTVVLSHVLEHMPDPLVTLREVNRVMSPGGSLILWLPNAESIESRLIGRYWMGYDAPRHLTTFSVDTLTRALSDAGFDIKEVRHEAIGLEWAWGLRHFLRYNLPSAERFAAALHPLLIIAATPLAAIGAITRRSGRVGVVATKVAPYRGAL